MTNSNERIGFRLRANAWLLDGIVICVGGFFMGGLIGGALGSAGGSSPDALVGGFLAGVLGSIIGMAVLANALMVWETATGAALGKLCFGMKIMLADGSPASPKQLLIRSLVKYNGMVLVLVGAITSVQTLGSLAQLGNLVAFIGCFLALGGEKQALHDKVAGTAVYRKGASS